MFLVVVPLLVVLVAGCQSGPIANPVGGIGNAPPRDAVAATGWEMVQGPDISIAPAADAANVPLNAAVRVEVSDGIVTDVKASASGHRLDGDQTPDNTGWVSTDGLAPGSSYRVEVEAVNAVGATSHRVSTFRTIRPSKLLRADVSPSGAERVGVGMPVVVTFNNPVRNKTRVEKRLHVQTSNPVEGAWSWLSSTEVHYRPRTYWPAQTQVAVRADLQGVRAGAGAWGMQDEVRRFRTVKRAVVTKVNLASHQTRVLIDGRLARTIPVTGGQPGWETRDGTKVILQKEENKIFTDEAIDAPENYELFSRWALRVTWSGEFLHTASWSLASQGVANVSHGCVGMSSADSEWLWRVSSVGDPVETKSPGGDAMTATGNGYGDWNVSWSDWKAGSALS